MYQEYIKLSESIDKWENAYMLPTEDISKPNPCDYYELSFNQALFMLLGLKISALDFEPNNKGYIIDDNYKTRALRSAISIGENFFCTDEYNWLSCQLKSESIPTKTFIEIAVESKFLRKMEKDAFRSLPSDVEKILFYCLIDYQLISKDSNLDDKWIWLPEGDHLLVYLMLKMQKNFIGYNNKDQYKIIESYIPRKNKSELRQVAYKVRQTKPNGFEKIDKIVNILDSKCLIS